MSFPFIPSSNDAPWDPNQGMTAAQIDTRSRTADVARLAQVQALMARQVAQGRQNQLAGYDPGVTPEFVAQQQFMQQRDAADSQRAQVANLQLGQQAIQTNMLPDPGQQPTATQQAAMQEWNQSHATSAPMSLSGWQTRQRLQGTMSAFPEPLQGQIKANLAPSNLADTPHPQDVMDHPTFQRMMQNNPEMASRAFKGITGHDFAPFAAARAANTVAINTSNLKFYNEAAQKGDVRLVQDPTGVGALHYRVYKEFPDPMNPGATTRRATDEFQPLDPQTPQGRALYAGAIASAGSPQEREALALAMKGPYVPSAAKVAAAAPAPSIFAGSLPPPQQQTGQDIYGQAPTPGTQAADTFNGMIGSVGQAVKSVATLQPWKAWDATPGMYLSPHQQPVQHMAGALQNNPRLKAMLASPDPAMRQRALSAIMQMQSGQSTQSLVEPPAPAAPYLGLPFR